MGRLRTERTLTDSELATILHALRVLQCEGEGEGIKGCAAGLCGHFDDAKQLTTAEIDKLCEALNVDEWLIEAL